MFILSRELFMEDIIVFLVVFIIILKIISSIKGWTFGETITALITFIAFQTRVSIIFWFLGLVVYLFDETFSGSGSLFRLVFDFIK